MEAPLRSALCVQSDSQRLPDGGRWNRRSSGCEMSFMISTTFLKQPVLSELDLPLSDGCPCAPQSQQSSELHSPQQFRAGSPTNGLRFVNSSLPARPVRAGKKELKNSQSINYLRRKSRASAPQAELINTPPECDGLQTRLKFLQEICCGLVPPSEML